jgi:hypothetical protein
VNIIVPTILEVELPDDEANTSKPAGISSLDHPVNAEVRLPIEEVTSGIITRTHRHAKVTSTVLGTNNRVDTTHTNTIS